ncbi:MAG: hypothetical protein HGA31_00620 [Candidatus Moranbacteria bacterium]|nr:hypothetical protein [Candidatus Moranbacteria bacterium]
MPKTETVVSEGTEENKRRGKAINRKVFVRRLKRAVFLSAIFFVLGMSVLAISPRQDTVDMSPAATVSVDGNGICNVLAGKEFRYVFGAEAETIENFSTERDHCKELLATGGIPEEGDPSGLEDEVRAVVFGYPIEEMAPVIAEYDREIAALIVGIAKKESDWGKHAPTLAGRDCRNYWGLKGSGSLGMAMGYACFGSADEAAHAVGDRIAELVAKRQASSPEKLIVWKCGNTCAGHSPESVQSWISGVRMYYDKIARS